MEDAILVSHTADIGGDQLFKKLLPPEGVECLFLRERAKQIKNGRFDVEATIMDADGELVVVVNLVAFIVVDKGFTNAKEGGL